MHKTWIRRAFGVFLERPYQSKAVMPLEEGRQFAHTWSLARQRQDCWSLGLFRSLGGPGSSYICTRLFNTHTLSLLCRRGAPCSP